MEQATEILPQTYLVHFKKFADERGDFVKTYAATVFAALNTGFALRDVREEYYSVSHRNVIRGMHFQVPPHDHGKFVYCAVGAVLDVVLDLRAGPGYGKSASVALSANEPRALVIPKGLAHGFKSLQDGSLMHYKTTTEYAPQCDRGIRWDSFGFDWGTGEPVISERDRAHPALADFVTPF